ncbi:MAG: GNAT family N-acetyltransferase [Dehalococcoidia bacterium]|nr:GNAT family N-acetyltransferase [Dehalococcoidia bacterium]
MVDTALPGQHRAARAEYNVARLLNIDEIRGLLAPEGAYATYARAQLAPPLFAQSEWWSASGPRGRAIVLHARGGLGRAMVTMGDHEALDIVLGLHPGPRFCFASFRSEHKKIVQRHFMLARNELMVRMSVTGEAFRPVEGETVRLRGPDIGRVNRLYSAEGGPASYTSRHIEDGVYYGVIQEGKLVSIAGTHVDSAAERVAVVGNVFTHPLYRGGGLATIATSAVTAALLEHCDFVALTVEAANEPALAVYTRLGYREECTLYETAAVRKDALGILSAARRVAAAWRGRRQGKEIALR